MPATGTTTFSDPSDFQADFRGATINLVFTGPGMFSARLTSVSLPHLRLFSVRESLPRIAYVSLPPEWVIFAFPTLAEPPTVWGGVEMNSNDLMFHSVGERMHQRTSGATTWCIISVNPEFFAGSSKALTGSGIIPPRVGRVLRPLRADVVELRRRHAKVCRLAETRPQAFAHREIARAIEHDIMQMLINCLMGKIVCNDTSVRRRYAALMNWLEETLAGHSDRQLTIPELCSALGVAERSLRTCCFDFLGMSSNQYIRLRRLNLVHKALRHADPATAKISEIAAQYGFSEFGRLAGLYRTVFGELPSTILRRSRPAPHNPQFAENT